MSAAAEPRVLVVEDESTIAITLEMALSEANMAVECGDSNGAATSF